MRISDWSSDVCSSDLQLAFISPGARYVDRLPIGTLEVLETANAEDIRAFYRRTYVPGNAVLVIIGDYPLDLLEERVRHWFEDWRGDAAPPDPPTGPLALAREGERDIYLHQRGRASCRERVW